MIFINFLTEKLLLLLLEKLFRKCGRIYRIAPISLSLRQTQSVDDLLAEVVYRIDDAKLTLITQFSGYPGLPFSILIKVHLNDTAV